MGQVIEGGASGAGQEVTTSMGSSLTLTETGNAGVTRGVNSTIWDQALANGKAFVIDIPATDPTGAGDYIYYLENTDSDEKLAILAVSWNATGAAGTLTMEVAAAGTPASATTRAPTNLNRDSAVTASVTSGSGVDLDSASGLDTSTNLVVKTMELTTVDTDYSFTFPIPILLGTNDAFQVSDSSATAVVNGQVWIAFVG